MTTRARRREAERRGPAPEAPAPKGGAFIAAYAALGAAEIAAEWFAAPAVVWATKPLLMPALLAWVVAETRERPTGLTQALLLALAFSFLGDVFLMFPSDLFTWGLGSFLVAHLAWIAAFFRRPPGVPPPKEFPRGSMALSLPIHLYTAAMVTALVPHLGDDTVPVLVYMAVLFTMAIASVLRRGRVPDASFWSVYAGACAFVVSDSLIALHRFVAPVPFHRPLVMATYLLAQYWIVRGLLIQHRAERTG